MITQYDSKVRVVSLANLEAMCEHVSGVMCHKFKVEKVTRSRVHVSYSNENEYATPDPIIAIFPCYPALGGSPDARNSNPLIVLDIIRIINDYEDESGDQSFYCLIDCPQMWHNPMTNKWEVMPETVKF